MTRLVLKRPQALHDIDEIAYHVAKGGWAVAERFTAEVQNACSLLADMPNMGPSCEFENARAADVRFWPLRGFENYLLFYRPIEDGIELLRVLHGARDYRRLFE